MRAIRRTNLELVMKQRGLRPVDVIRLVNDSNDPDDKRFSPSQFSDITREGSTKPFGDKLARRLERALQLPRWFLDQPQTPDAVNVATAASRPSDNDAFFKPKPSAAAEQLVQLFDALPEGQLKREVHATILRTIARAQDKLNPSIPRRSGPSPEPTPEPSPDPGRPPARSRPRP